MSNERNIVIKTTKFEGMKSDVYILVFEDNIWETVAILGKEDDPTSKEYAKLFSQAPQLKKTNELLIKTLEKAEKQLNAIWIAEISDMKKYNQ